MRVEGSPPDVEIPGTKIGLKTLVQVVRSVLGRHPKHIEGDIVLAAVPGSDPAREQLQVTVYVTRGRDRSQGIRLSETDSGINSLAHSTAEMVLSKVDPYMLAAYKVDQGELATAIEIVQRITQDPPRDRDPSYVLKAFNLWGIAFGEQGKPEEAIVKFQKALELDPK